MQLSAAVNGTLPDRLRLVQISVGCVSEILRLRPARPPDCATLTALAQESKAAWPYPPAQIEAWRSELTITPASLVAPTIVAEDASGIVGFMQVAGFSAGWQLEHCWVRPGARGRGVGRTLVEHAMELVRTARGTGIAIDADPHAEGFYLSLGASRVGEVAAPIAGDPARIRPQLWLAA